MKGIEPSYAAWEAAVLPLNYTRFEQEGESLYLRVWFGKVYLWEWR